MDFETIKNNAINAFRQLTVLRVIVTSPNEKVADVPALMRWSRCCWHRGSVQLCWFWASCSNTAFDSRKTPSECDPPARACRESGALFFVLKNDIKLPA